MVQFALPFEFCVERMSDTGLLQPGRRQEEQAPAGSGTHWCQIPVTGVSYLAVSGDGPPQVLAKPPQAEFAVALLEPVRYQQQHHLAICAGPDLRINGRSAAPVAILKVGDQLRVGDLWLLHLSRFVRPYIGTPPSDYVDKECCSCRLPITADTVIYICPNCGTAYHCEDPSADDGKQEDERGPLECARLISICSHCPQPVVLGSRHEFIPDD